MNREQLAYLNAQVAQIEDAQARIREAQAQMQTPNDVFNNPWTRFGAALMSGSDPRREGLGGVGSAVLHTADDLRAQQQRQQAAQMANLQAMGELRQRQLDAARAAAQQQMVQSYVQSLPEAQRPAALLAPKEFAKQQAQSAYREEKTSTAQRIFQEMGGQQGTGKSFPQWYAEDYKSGGPTINVGGMKESVRKEVMSLGSFEDALNRYEQLLDQYGTEVVPGEGKQRLSTAYTNLLMQAKEAANLGALSGPDLGLIQDMLSDPTAVTAGVRPTSQYKAQVDELRRMLSSRKSRFIETLPEEQQATVQGGGWQSTGSGARWRAK